MSPLEIKILLDLYSLSDPDEAWDPKIVPQKNFIYQLFAKDIIVIDPLSNHILKVDHDALTVYYNEIAKVLLPVKGWMYK